MLCSIASALRNNDHRVIHTNSRTNTMYNQDCVIRLWMKMINDTSWINVIWFNKFGRSWGNSCYWHLSKNGYRSPVKKCICTFSFLFQHTVLPSLTKKEKIFHLSYELTRSFSAWRMNDNRLCWGYASDDMNLSMGILIQICFIDASVLRCNCRSSL